MIKNSLRTIKKINLNRWFRFSETSKQNVPSTAVDQQKPHIMDEQQIQQQQNRRLKELELRHKELQRLVDKQVRLPLKLYGTKDSYSSSFSYLTQRIMGYYRVHPTMITDFILKIYKASLYAMVDQNESFMDQYWQKGLKQNVLANIRDVKKNYTLSIVEDKDFMKDMPQKCQILDTICVRGITMDRETIRPPQDYIKMVQADQVGLITYTPKYLTQDNQKFIDPKENKKVYQGYQNMVMRVLLRVRTPLRFNVKEIPVSDQLYTWEHLIVMQNQMVPPKHLESKYKLETLMQWLGKYRFGMWKIVDIDNFMKGNSPFRKYQKQDEYMDPIFEGTVFDRSAHANIRKF